MWLFYCWSAKQHIMIITDIIALISGYLFGFGIAGLLIVIIYKRNAIDWDILARTYSRAWVNPLAQKRIQNAVLYSKGRPAKSYNGLVTIGLFQDGVGFRLNSFLAPFHRPIFVPYADLRGYKQDWYLNVASTELGFEKVPSMRLIMPAAQVDWIESATKGKIFVLEQYPPHDNWPWMTRIASLILAGMTLCVALIWLSKVLH